MNDERARELDREFNEITRLRSAFAEMIEEAIASGELHSNWNLHRVVQAPTTKTNEWPQTRNRILGLSRIRTVATDKLSDLDETTRVARAVDLIRQRAKETRQPQESGGSSSATSSATTRPTEGKVWESNGALVVDNRVLILGLDNLYRSGMRVFETDVLLGAAETVAGILGVEEAEVPIEGYYHETPELQRYFKLLRALQRRPSNERASVTSTESFSILDTITRSGLYGQHLDDDYLLPGAWDPISEALRTTEVSDWTFDVLAQKALESMEHKDDISLVGLALRTMDPITVVACRESTVLYSARPVRLGDVPLRRFDWRVEDSVAAAANRFIDTFNNLTGSDLPPALLDNAEAFHDAYADSEILGRCVAIGTDRTADTRHYHWAIRKRAGGPSLHEFWSSKILTTKNYRSQMDRPAPSKSRKRKKGLLDRLRGS